MTGPVLRRVMAAAGLALLFFAMQALDARVMAQITGQVTGLGRSDGPLEINADQGIEWRRNQRLYIARGNASAARGDLTVYADVLTAHYRERAGKASEIYQIDALGNVRIVSPSETAYADNGVYEVERGLLVLRGGDLRLVTPNEVVRARDTLEYWEVEEVAVARGAASAVRGERQIEADVLTGYFSPNEQGELEMSTLKADGNVRITTPREFARSRNGVYYIGHELVTLTGDVKITRGENQANGEYAEIDLDTGVNRLLGAAPGQKGDSRVRSLLVPGSLSDDDSGS